MYYIILTTGLLEPCMGMLSIVVNAYGDYITQHVHCFLLSHLFSNSMIYGSCIIANIITAHLLHQSYFVKMPSNLKRKCFRCHTVFCASTVVHIFSTLVSLCVRHLVGESDAVVSCAGDDERLGLQAMAYTTTVQAGGEGGQATWPGEGGWMRDGGWSVHGQAPLHHSYRGLRTWRHHCWKVHTVEV